MYTKLVTSCIFLTIDVCIYSISGDVLCIFKSDMNHVSNATRNLFVLTRPSVKVSPLSLTVREGQHVHVICQATVFGTHDQGKVQFKWFKWNGKEHEAVSIKGNNGKSEQSS